MSKRLKILQVTNRLPYPLTDGGNIATYYVTHYLNEFGHQVTLASLNTRKHHQDPLVLSHIAKVYDQYLDTSITAGGLLKGIFEKMPYNVRRFISEEFSELLVQILTEDTFDVIQMEGSYLALYTEVLREYSKAPIVLRSHNIEHEIWQRMSENDINPLRKWYFGMLARKIRYFEQKHMHDFDAIVAITGRDEEYYRSHGFKGKLLTINAGVDLQKFAPSEEPPLPRTFCHIGNMEWMPNKQGMQWFLEEVWPLLYNEFPGIEFHMAGKAMPDRMIQAEIPGVRVHGMVPDAVEFLNRYEVFIVPLLSGGGMRLKIVEGLALGKCIISTTVGAEGVLWTEGKDIMMADTPEQFVEKVRKVYANPSLASSIGKEALKLAKEHYDWAKLVRKFESLYFDLIKGQKN